MSRLLTCGFEIAEKGSASTNLVDVDGGSATAADVALQGTTFRSGALALERLAGTSQWRSNWSSGAGVAERIYYCRLYFRIAGTAAAANAILSFVDSAAVQLARVLITTANRLRLDDGTTQIGSDSVGVLAADTWYMVELAMMQSATPGIEYAEARLEGVSFAASSALTSWTTNPIGVSLGAGTSIGQTTFYDDLSVNDDQGADQNTWPGEGKIVLLEPISDAQVGAWTGGAGGTSNLFEAVNNKPPVGTATETDTSQIESTDDSGDNSTDEYRATLTKYLDAGLSMNDLIKVLHPVINHGEDAAGGTKTGSFGLQANPSQTYTAFTYGDDVGALGTWPTNWRWTLGAVVYNPEPDRNMNPVLALRTTDSAAGAVRSVDFMGLYLEYTPGPPRVAWLVA